MRRAVASLRWHFAILAPVLPTATARTRRPTLSPWSPSLASSSGLNIETYFVDTPTIADACLIDIFLIVTTGSQLFFGTLFPIGNAQARSHVFLSMKLLPSAFSCKWRSLFVVFIGLGSFGGPAFAAVDEIENSFNALKKMSLEQLMDVEITSVSRRPEKLFEAASAIQVITDEDIRRSGAMRLPEALHLASNLEVAKIDSGQWAIMPRGFNSHTRIKILVMIDGRTIYTPLYAGVFWDVQDTLLEDIDRI